MSTAKRNKFSITVDGKHYDIEVLSAHDGQIKLLVNGREHTVEINTAREEAQQNQPAVPRQSSETPVSPPSPSTARSSITAPMPGDILEVYVHPGDRVEPGQAVCVLEAMKMKNVLRVVEAGVVAQVRVQPGQRVAYGDILVEMAKPA